MPRRKRFQEVEMPAWVTEEAAQEGRELVPVPVRREEAKQPAYLYAQIEEDERPWYLQSQEPTQRVEDQTWYDRLVNQLAAYLSDMIYLHGSKADIDQLIESWLSSHTELYRAVLINLLTEEDLRNTLFNKNLGTGVVNSVVRLVFS
jgi:hypothetical protein